MLGQGVLHRLWRWTAAIKEARQRGRAQQEPFGVRDEIKQHRVDYDREQGTREDQAILVLTQYAERQPTLPNDERELADLT